MVEIDEEMKTKVTTYNKVKSAVEQNERKTTGNLLVRSVDDLVKAEHFVLDSEYLITLIVVVPKKKLDDWFATYEQVRTIIV